MISCCWFKNKKIKKVAVLVLCPRGESQRAPSVPHCCPWTTGRARVTFSASVFSPLTRRNAVFNVGYLVEWWHTINTESLTLFQSVYVSDLLDFPQVTKKNVQHIYGEVEYANVAGCSELRCHSQQLIQMIFIFGWTYPLNKDVNIVTDCFHCSLQVPDDNWY